MSTNTVYRVTYHLEKNGRRVSETFQDNVLAANQDFSTINSVLSSNSRIQTGTSVVIEGIGHGSAAGGVLS